MTVPALLDRHPIIGAPMAGGISTPALAAAVSQAGGLGFLAAGYLSPDVLATQIDAVRSLTAEPFGVNVFVPSSRRRAADAPNRLSTYRDALVAEASRLGVVPGEPVFNDDGFAQKIELLIATRVPVVSFTFGCPSSDIVARLETSGITVVATVTTPTEAAQAQAAGVHAICVQGPDAGGHRGCFDPANPANTEAGAQPMLVLLEQIRATVTTPLIAAGGIADSQQIAAVLRAGAIAVQLGTALLRTPESGASDAYKAALVDPRFAETAVTTVFSGRPGRALVNRFVTDYADIVPPYFPEVHYLTAPLRQAATKQGDVDFMAMWAGSQHADARTIPAGQLVAELIDQLASTSVGDLR